MRVTIIADASFCPDLKVGGYGFWIATERGKLGGGGPMRDHISTSAAAEMAALVNALHVAVQQGLVQSGDEVLLQTDCVPAIQGFEGRRALNKDELRASNVMRTLKNENSLILTFRHVRGHTRRQEARYVTNNLCDVRAKNGLREARHQCNIKQLKELLK